MKIHRFELVLPSQEELRARFDYDPELGELRHRARDLDDPMFESMTRHSLKIFNSRFAGKLVTGGTTVINGNYLSVPRVIHKWMTGLDPDGYVRYANGVDLDNRWANLVVLPSAVPSPPPSAAAQNLHVLPSQEILKAFLDYSPDTGDMHWKPREEKHFPDARASKIWNTRFAEKKAGSISQQDGYMKLRLDGKAFQMHRIIHKWMTGEEPPTNLDHINGVRSDNRWANIRAADYGTNQHNKPKQINNTSGIKGVNFDEGKNKWRGRLHHNHKEYSVMADSKEEAQRLLEQMREELHGSFANHGEFKDPFKKEAA